MNPREAAAFVGLLLALVGIEVAVLLHKRRRARLHRERAARTYWEQRQAANAAHANRDAYIRGSAAVIVTEAEFAHIERFANGEVSA